MSLPPHPEVIAKLSPVPVPEPAAHLQEKLPLESRESTVTEKNQFEVPADDADFPDGGLRAWLIVLGGVCMTTATFGIVNSWGAFQTYYSQNILSDSSQSTLSWIGSLQYALTFFPGIFAGRMFDLGHFRVPMLCFSIFLLAVTFLIAECTRYWHFLLCQGFAVGGASGLLFGPVLGCMSHWFKRRRSTAYAIVACGSSIGGTVFPILVRNLIPVVGFRWTIRILGLVLSTFLGISNLTLRRRLPPVNVSGGLFNIRVLKHPPFSAYVAAGFFCFLGQYTVLTYIDSSAESYGISGNLAFYLVAIANASSALGRISSGVLSDRIGPLNTIMPITMLTAVMTYAWPYAHTSRSMIIIAIFYGISSGAFVGLLIVPITNMGDTGDVGRRQGIVFSLLAVGAILGPPISGLINTETQGYTAVGFYAGSMIVLGVVFMFISRSLLLRRFWGGKA